MAAVCYLCGTEIPDEELSEDHVVPKQFIKRKQPRERGFDYAGLLPTHKRCNNQFGDERMCQKSLRLMDVLMDPDCVVKRQHKDDPEARIIGIDSSCLSEFGPADLKFFKITDIRDCRNNQWLKPAFYKDKPKTNPTVQPLSVALSVLTKSAAAFLVKRFNVAPNTRWRVLCMPYHGTDTELDFDGLLGKTKPFEVGVKLWVTQPFTNDFFAVYRSQSILLYTFFWLSGRIASLREVKRIFSDVGQFSFVGSKLIHLSGHDWTKYQL